MTNSNFTPDIEKRPLNEIRDFQERKLQEQIQYLANRSGYYRELFAEHHLDPRKINRLSDLVHVPVTTKDHLQKRNRDFLCVPENEIIDYLTRIKSPCFFSGDDPW